MHRYLQPAQYEGMKYEKNKKMFRSGCTCLLTALSTALFLGMWAAVYNYGTVFPYYFKGFVMLGFMYFMLMAFFIWLFNGFQIGYLRSRSAFLSQVMSVLVVNIIFYLVTCLLSTYLVPAGGFLVLSLADILLMVTLTKLFNIIFDKAFGEIDLLLIYGDHNEDEIKRMSELWQGKYRIGETISINRGRHLCIAAAAGHDAVIICDVPVGDRNVIADYCQEKGILTYFTPRLSDMLFPAAGGLKYFDSPSGDFTDLFLGRPLSAARRFSLIGYLKKVYKGSVETLYERISVSADRGEKEFIITANPETLMNGLESSDFDRAILEDKSIVIPDGYGLIKALAISGYGRCNRITGIDFATMLLRMADVKGLSLYLYGAAEEVINGMAALVKREYPHASLLGYANGYDRDPDEVMEEARSLQPDIIMVALGVPAQEILISQHMDSFKKGIFIGVGGSFDVMTGKKKRAPGFFIKHNLEWLYRITTEPVRLRRFFRYNLRFIREVMRIESIR